jgi:Protein of unknown function (DUF1461)
MISDRLHTLKSIPLTGGILVSLYLCNITLLIFVLTQIPELLIYNRDFLNEHRAIMTFLQGGALLSRDILPEDQLSHIHDVQKLTKLLPVASISSVLGTGIIYTKLSDTKLRQQAIKYALIAVMAVAPICAIFFTSFFILFHQVLFPQGNWSFPADSVLIQLYPEPFWVKMFLILSVATIVQCVVLNKVIK